ncbi:MAG: hypothetical protein KKD31_17465 [Bacteroidetes bacterium]|nr:hypothetical protein [Bacteroidota bacterium]
MKERNMTNTSINSLTISQLKNIDLAPRKFPLNRKHLFADFVELVSFFSSGPATLNDVLDRYRQEGIRVCPNEKIPNQEIGSDTFEDDDLNELWMKEVFETCEFRQNVLQDAYPYNVNDGLITLSPTLSDRQNLYLMLLLSSNLNYFPDFEAKLTSDFETVSFFSLKSFLPESAIIKRLGAKSDYHGMTSEKIKTLGRDLNVFINEKVIDQNVFGTKERGLDIIGWIPFRDKVPNMVVLYGQCACGKEWYKKQTETRRYETSYFPHFKHIPINTMFIPYALVEDENSFFQQDEIYCLLFERFRILEYLQTPTFFNELETKQILVACIKNIKEFYPFIS